MNINQRTDLLIQFGKFLDNFLNDKKNTLLLEAEDYQWFEHQMNLASGLNPWFTEENIYAMLKSWAFALTEDKILQWTLRYNFQEKVPKTIGVVMAGNIPMVGFHDLLSVFVSGNKLLGKLSSEDKILIPAIVKIFEKLAPSSKNYFEFTQDKLQNFDAIIATGSNNTARYFEYYFGKYPNIIRKNRNGVGVLTGKESTTELGALGADIFTYFGLGCRNVSKLYLPLNYSFDELFNAFEKYSPVFMNHKYVNNYDFNKSVYLVNKEPHFDNGFLLLKESNQIVSPISVVFFEYYEDLKVLNKKLQVMYDQIQCIVSHSDKIENKVGFGQSQQPELWDYADGVDTLEFLLNL